mmetsp:Transcript_22913/g.68109  ORF Transcript_22913/g.68109 Transcript_22913/m.68109 type:complete len:166 (-) Transcript_22913:98-595(-)
MVSWPRFGIFNPTNGQWFKNLAQKNFDSVDMDKDGALDRKELYIALLKMYDTLNDALPCHMLIPQSEEVDRLLKEFDLDQSNSLEFPEFLQLCKTLCASKKNWRKSIPLRVVCAVTLKLALIPAAGILIKKGITAAVPSSKKYVPTGITAFAAEKVYKLAGGGII